MTVASSTDRATFPGNGVTQIFPLPFRFFANSEIQAWLVTNATGALTALTLGTHYTLSGAGDPEVDGNPTSELTMLTAPTALQSLFVLRVIPVTQPTDIVNQGRFFPEIHENVFDRLTMLIQQANGESKGAIRVAIGDPEPNRLAPAVSRANQLMGFDSQGNPIAVSPVSGDAADLALSLANNTDPAKGAALIGRALRFIPSIAALRATDAKYDKETIFLIGWHADLPAFGHGLFVADAADISSADDGGTIIVSTGGSRWKRQVAEWVDPADFGARYNTDDESAFLVSACASGYKVTTGERRLTTKSAAITQSVTFVGNLKPHSSAIASDSCAIFSGAGSNIKANVDALGMGITGITLSGAGSYADVTTDNITGLPQIPGGTQSALLVVAEDCTVRVAGSNHLKGTSTNDSIPRLLSSDAGSDGLHVELARGLDINCGWVQSTTGGVTCDVLDVKGSTDNTLYALGGTINIGTVTSELSTDEVIVAVGCTVNIGDLNVVDCIGSNRVEDAAVTVGVMNIRSSSSAFPFVPFSSRPGNTSSVVTISQLIGTIRMTAAANGAAIFQFLAGAVDLFLGEMSLNARWVTGASTTLVTHSSGYLQAGEIRIILSDDSGTLTGATAMQWSVPTLASSGGIEALRLITSTATLRVAGAIQTNFNPPVGAQMQGNVGPYIFGTAAPKILHGSGIPTAGTWLIGDKIYAISPAAGGFIGWVCTASGTPGIWKTFGAISA